MRESSNATSTSPRKCLWRSFHTRTKCESNHEPLRPGTLPPKKYRFEYHFPSPTHKQSPPRRRRGASQEKKRTATRPVFCDGHRMQPAFHCRASSDILYALRDLGCSQPGPRLAPRAKQRGARRGTIRQTLRTQVGEPMQFLPVLRPSERAAVIPGLGLQVKRDARQTRKLETEATRCRDDSVQRTTARDQRTPRR